MRAAVVLLLAGACNFSTHGAAPSDATDAPGIDAPDAPTGDGSGSGSAIAGRKKPITIQKTKVAGAVDDFPVWIDLDDADIAASARADGQDIHFTDGNGVALDHEIESWDKAMHRLKAWVRVPHLDNNTNVTIFVGYGDVAQAVTPDPSGVFRSGFAAVWHLDDTLANNTVIADATGTHTGTAVGFNANQQVTAQLGGGLSFDGTSRSMVTFTNPLLGNTAHTISAWVDQKSTTAYSAILTVGTAGTDQARFLYGNYLNSGTLGIGQYSDDWVPTGHDLRNAGWKLVHWVHEGQNKKVHIYIDGVEIPGGHTMGTAPSTTGTAGYIGYAPEPQFGNPTGMNGGLDEVRIATVVRNAAWIGTEHNNQASPATFYTVGAEQQAP